MKKQTIQKFLNISIIFFLFILFSIFYAKEYFLFHDKKQEINKNILNSKSDLQNFSLENIRTLEYVDIYKTPDKNLLKILVEKIKNAKTRIYVEAYIFTEKDLRSALVYSKKRWVEVKVLMEKNVYKANNINKKTYDEFIKNQIEVVRSDSNDYSLNHSKFFIIDDEIVISTWNFSYSMFTRNRDFILFIKDRLLLEKKVKNFEYDFKKDKNFVYDENLVLSPFYSREKIEKLIKSAKKDIKIYFPYFSDDNLVKLLENKVNEGIDIKIITDKKNEKIEEFQSLWINVKILPKLTEHAKSILVDDMYLYVWSINFSTFSLDKNKETWIILKDINIIEKYIKFFSEDFKE